jgi:hypothetical protein
MPHTNRPLLALLALLAAALLAANAHADPGPSATGTAEVRGSVWVDSDCDGWKEPGEPPVANSPIMQFINTGADRVLTTGDRGQTLYTNQDGTWESGQVSIDDFDGIPYVSAIAVGKGSAAALGYKPAPAGGDSILSGAPFYASPTFSLVKDEIRQLGPIGVCPLDAGLNYRAYLPLTIR